jgi:hypothetical protein
MKLTLSIVAVAAALVATPASAQYFYVNSYASPVMNAYAYADGYANGYYMNLTGQYQCVQACSSGMPYNLAYVTQNGRELTVVDDLGMASRAWMDAPGRIWVERANQGAVFSADGMTIQFDRGTIWQRVVNVVDYYPAPYYAPRRHRHR